MMMAWEDDVMVSDGIRQEIGGLTGVWQLNDLLGSAQVGFCLVADQLTLFDEKAGEVAWYLEDGDGSFLHISSDAYTDAWFKMGVELITLD